MCSSKAARLVSLLASGSLANTPSTRLVSMPAGSSLGNMRAVSLCCPLAARLVSPPAGSSLGNLRAARLGSTPAGGPGSALGPRVVSRKAG